MTPATAPATVAGPVTQARVIRAEWTKLRALRSTRWSALTAIVLIVGLGAIIAGRFLAVVATPDGFGGCDGAAGTGRVAAGGEA